MGRCLGACIAVAECGLADLLRPRALRWLSQREHSEAELRRKLLRLAITSPLTLSQPAALQAAQESAAQCVDEGGDDCADECVVEGVIEGVVEGPLEEVVQGVIEWLKERHYLSDQRFIESRLRSRSIRWGVQRIQHELSQHGLSLGEAERQQLAQSELQRAQAIRVRKFGPALPADAAARATQARFLMQRGFAVEVARRVLRGDGTPELDGV